ncbi:protein CutA homolog [Xenopus laevis]|uniref:Protein CutA homolog n=2 Tax=Xenopus laevis TaxID=8355 RepID=A0A1L8F649_XENLA|nr:protein CutA homolog [Xenopus laevis]OCT67062.1 hypothetical protein XELAEV_18038343mg [Xenopus laevis]
MNCRCCQGPPQNGHRSAWILILLVILGSCMNPVLKSIFSELHSAISGSYISGSNSLVFVNCPNEQIAKEIARGILEKRLAASVNIMPKTSVLSISNGEIEESTEILLIIRTKTSEMHELFAYIRFVHIFETPDFISVAIDQGNLDHLKWIENLMSEN